MPYNMPILASRLNVCRNEVVCYLWYIVRLRHEELGRRLAAACWFAHHWEGGSEATIIQAWGPISKSAKYGGLREVKTGVLPRSCENRVNPEYELGVSVVHRTVIEGAWYGRISVARYTRQYMLQTIKPPSVTRKKIRKDRDIKKKWTILFNLELWARGLWAVVARTPWYRIMSAVNLPHRIGASESESDKSIGRLTEHVSNHGDEPESRP